MARPVLRTTARGKQGPRGPQGERGPQGLPATGAAEDDAAIATFASTPGTATHSALAEQIGTEIETEGTPARTALNAAIGDSVQPAVAAEFEAAATIEDVAFTATLDDIATATTRIIGVATRGGVMQQASFAFAAAVAASDTDYWTVTLNRVRAGTVSPIATKTTRAINGQAVAAYADWNFDVATFGNNELGKGDVLTATFTPTGSPAPLTGGMVAYVMPPADVALPVTLVSDSFNRPNAGSLGTADFGGAWLTSTAWGIVGNAAASTGVASAVIETGEADVTVEVKVLSAVAGPIFRYVDTDNHWGVSSSQIFRRLDGTLTSVGVLTYDAGDTIRVVTKGSTISVYRDAGSTGAFTLLGTWTSSVHATATKHGLRASGSSSGLGAVDDFLVTT